MPFQLNFKSVIYCIVFTLAINAKPPYFWYSTYAIDNYGCSYQDCFDPHHPASSLWGAVAEAEGFKDAVMDHTYLMNDVRNQFSRNNSEVTYTLWQYPTAEINYSDFVFYAGHGIPWGPLFTECVVRDSKKDFRFGSGRYLKWIQAAACSWFSDAYHSCGENEITRWNNAFCGIHSILAHRCISFQSYFPYYMSEDFFNRWLYYGQDIFTAWKISQMNWVYYNNSTLPIGIAPAIMAHNQSYATELWATAGDEQANSSTKNLYLFWATIGQPEF
jgi:hypothetical protein